MSFAKSASVDWLARVFENAMLRGVFALARRWVLLTVQIWTVLIAVHASGLVHDVADVVATLVTGTDMPDDDDCTGLGRECHCPAGCPNCHSSHVGRSLPQAAESGRVVAFGAAPVLSDVPYEASAPPVPDLLSIYRPPRSDSRSS